MVIAVGWWATRWRDVTMRGHLWGWESWAFLWWTIWVRRELRDVEWDVSWVCFWNACFACIWKANRFLRLAFEVRPPFVFSKRGGMDPYLRVLTIMRFRWKRLCWHSSSSWIFALRRWVSFDDVVWLVSVSEWINQGLLSNPGGDRITDLRDGFHAVQESGGGKDTPPPRWGGLRPLNIIREYLIILGAP